MGSLSSRPKVSTVHPTVFSAPAAPPVTTASNPVVPEPESVDDSGASETSREKRKENLLSRSRGRLSTVLTGFRGVLSDSVSSSSRKKLLGE